MVKKIIFLIMVLTISGCFKEMPEQLDGSLTINIVVLYNEEARADVPVNLSTAEYEISIGSEISDTSGIVVFQELPYARYLVNANTKISVPSSTDSTVTEMVPVVGMKNIEPDLNGVIYDTLIVEPPGSQPGLKINEIYTVGPVNRIFYFFDQYFELYNSAADTAYLDGMVFCRMNRTLDEVLAIFQFPGEPLVGRQYPVPPDSFVVLAADARDHRLIVPGSIDLTYAEWEFRCSLDYGDSDNPDVPNLENIEVGDRKDFMVGLTGDVLVLGDGSDADYLDGIDSLTVVDCVEYSAKASHIKTVSDFVDRGFAGVGQSNYTGTSIERIVPGYDTNNSTNDFVKITAPTPGYHHSIESDRRRFKRSSW